MRTFWLGLVVGILAIAMGAEAQSVRVWEEPLVIPTYPADPPDVNPMFRRPLSYQGASRVIYPYALQDGFSSEKEDRTYRALYLENEYIKLCILPELGGRLFYATDKTNGYEIFYRQQVIKPAHVGMLGAWISGGIEWCVFHHHRASTYMTVDSRLETRDDGGATIWIGELEPRHRMRWTIGITLYPGRSIIEATIKMVNRTPAVNSILYWANVATHVNDEYQIIFPPSTRFGVYHAKNDFIHWPIGRGEFRGRDYTGVDVSWWKNHPGSISIFAHDLREGFLAGYDHGRSAGTMLVANHHVAPGAKVWEWGKGSIWDTEILTDEDGPYAELMAGAYSDNQPDYSWIKPGEIKEAVQSWYPLRDIGGAKAATEEAAINLELDEDGRITLAVNTTRAHERAHVRLAAGESPLIDEPTALSPAHPYRTRLAMPANTAATDLLATVTDAEGAELARYRPLALEVPDTLPETVRPPRTPEDIGTVEELFLTGLRIRQFHNARLDPDAYFREALRRDPGHSGSHLQLGISSAGRWSDEEATAHFEAAIARISRDYTRPRDAEAHYQLGLIHKRQGQWDAAYEQLYRATWDFAFRAPAYYELAEIDCARGNFKTALRHVEEALRVNAQDTRAMNLRAAVSRRLGQPRLALQSAHEALDVDPLDHWAAVEEWLALREAGNQRARAQRRRAAELLRDQPESYLEIAATYIRCGLWPEARAVLDAAADRNQPGLSDYPIIHYYLAFVREQLGNRTAAQAARRAAAACPTDYAFPFRYESLAVLSQAIERNPDDARAYYYRGNLYYDAQPEQAIADWEAAVTHEPALAIAHRNLGWGHAYARGDIPAAIAAYQKAVAQHPEDPRYYFELDQLLERQGAPPEERLAILEENLQVVRRHQLPLLRTIAAWVQAGRYDPAIDALQNHYFHAQEGRDQVHDTHVDAHLLRGLQHFNSGEYTAALQDFLAADTYPQNHQTGRRDRYERDPQIFALTGLCYQQLGRHAEAQAALEQAAASRRAPGIYAYYVGLAQQALDRHDQANETFEALTASGQQALALAGETDFFAKFGEGDPLHVQQARAHLISGLGHLGLGQIDPAREAFSQAASLDPNNPWARYYLAQSTHDE